MVKYACDAVSMFPRLAFGSRLSLSALRRFCFRAFAIGDSQLVSSSINFSFNRGPFRLISLFTNAHLERIDGIARYTVVPRTEPILDRIADGRGGIFSACSIQSSVAWAECLRSEAQNEKERLWNKRNFCNLEKSILNLKISSLSLSRGEFLVLEYYYRRFFSYSSKDNESFLKKSWLSHLSRWISQNCSILFLCSGPWNFLLVFIRMKIQFFLTC